MDSVEKALEYIKVHLKQIEKTEDVIACEEILTTLITIHDGKTTPAARNFHHNYKGGWLVHTAEVIDFALKINEMIGKQYHPDEVILAGFLHDLEKPFTYVWKDENIKHINFPCSEEALVFNACAKVGLHLSLEVISAIEFAHGGWSTQANNRHVQPSNLSSIIHSADLMSSRFGKIGKNAILKSE